MDWFDGLLLIAALLQAIAFGIETSSWLLRSQSRPEDMGLYIGRSNIYLYSARMLTLIFTASLAFGIESGISINTTLKTIYAAFIFSVIVHVGLMFGGVRIVIMRAISRALLLPQRGQAGQNAGVHIVKTRLFWLTAATSIIFNISLTAPILGAILLPEYRLSISYIGQMINFVGVSIILLFVDQILFGAIDAKKIDEIILSYICGRLIGCMLVGIVFIFVGLNM